MAFSMPSVMRSHGLEPSLRTFHNLIRAALHNNHDAEAMAMLDEMRKSSLSPTLTTYNLLMRAAQREGDEAVISLYDRMQAENMQPGAYASGIEHYHLPI